MFYFFGKGKCTEVFQGIRDISPEVYCLIGKHLFSSISTRTRFTEVLLRCIPCIVCMPITSILEKVVTCDVNASMNRVTQILQQISDEHANRTMQA